MYNEVKKKRKHGTSYVSERMSCGKARVHSTLHWMETLLGEQGAEGIILPDFNLTILSNCFPTQ
jgi:hypothetical protein